MKVRVLGTAAGGGVPQWNCACDGCRKARAGGTAGMEVTVPAMQALTGRIDNYELNAREEDVTSLPQFSKLESKSGGDFDRAFLEQVQKDQEQAAKLTRSGTGKFSEDRVFASMLSRNEPVIQHHIRTAEQLKQRQ